MVLLEVPLLLQEGRQKGLQMKAVDLERFDPARLRGREAAAVFLVATYGEGATFPP